MAGSCRSNVDFWTGTLDDLGATRAFGDFDAELARSKLGLETAALAEKRLGVVTFLTGSRQLGVKVSMGYGPPMGGPTKVVARGPIAYIGGGVAIDCRFIDRVELATRFTDRSGIRLLLALESTEIAIEFAGSDAEAEDLIVGLAPYTRAAPLTNDVDYSECEDLRDSIYEGTYATPPIVLIGGEAVDVADGLVSVGMIAWPLDDVLEASVRGGHVELADGSAVAAAYLTLAIAAAQPPSIAALDQRLREFRELRRDRNPS